MLYVTNIVMINAYRISDCTKTQTETSDALKALETNNDNDDDTTTTNNNHADNNINYPNTITTATATTVSFQNFKFICAA